MKNPLHRRPGLISDRSGAAAIEFALVAPVFLALLTGVIGFSMLAFTSASLHYAVEAGARCEAVREAGCPGAASLYYGMVGSEPTFTVTSQACGKAVTGVVTLDLAIYGYGGSVPLSASACFPWKAP